MMISAMKGHAEIVRLLAEQKADLDTKDNDGKELWRDEERFEGSGWIWPSAINSDGETVKECGEGKRIKFQWIHLLFLRFKHLMRCHGQYAMDILNLPNRHQH